QIKRLARLSGVELLNGAVPKGAVQDVLDEATMVLPIADVIDVAVEQARLEKEISKQQNEINRFEKKLRNKKFLANAPEAVVKTEREKLADAKATQGRLHEARERLLEAG
ncbi:MAG: valine--tRNA ligase, partial [Rhodospirillales bacterium]|nr:valine--tRNA ligase [Rhodospirillales bacterium]